jgi:DNA-binding Lrp family transcriptional regulator
MTMRAQGTAEIPKSVETLNQLMNIVGGYVEAQAFVTACTLGLFEALGDGSKTPEDLAERLGIHPVGCRRLLSALANLGLVTREDGRFANSELGASCTSKSPVNFSTLAGFGNPFYHMFEFLPDALREYGPRWQQAVGATSDDVFAAMYADPKLLRDFAHFMNAMSIPQGQLIAQAFDFAPYECVMDIAGGPGGQAVQIGLKHPHLRGIISDLPPVCAIADEYIHEVGLGDRFKAMPADLFQGPYPAGADVIVLGHILHDWSDERCAVILRNCADALPRGGVLLVSEAVLQPDYSGSRFALIKDLTMIVACESGARERTEAEYEALLEAAGFDLARVIRLDAPRDLIVARKR